MLGVLGIKDLIRSVSSFSFNVPWCIELEILVLTPAPRNLSSKDPWSALVSLNVRRLILLTSTPMHMLEHS